MDNYLPIGDEARREANESAIDHERRTSVARRDNQDWDQINALLLKSDLWKKHIEKYGL